MTFGFFKSAAGSTKSDRPSQLEGEFQYDLHHALAARADERIAGREVRRQERSAERGVGTGGISSVDGTGSARRIGGDGMVENVEDFPACLDAITLLECKVLEDGHVPVLEAL